MTRSEGRKPARLEPYAVPRGRCPHCRAANVRHLIIGLPANPAAMTQTPPWVDWVGCLDPGHDRICDECGHTWTSMDVDRHTPPPVRPKAVPTRGRDALAFRHYEIPLGVSLSAVLPETSPRCGIYVLHFDNGYQYVGQAQDVLTRFGTHRRRWRHLTGLDFAPAPPGNLDDLERRTIQEKEKEGVRLYNSALVGLPMGENALDLVVDRVEQEQWLEGASDTSYDLADRIATAAGRPHSSRKLEALRSRADYGELRFTLLLYLLAVVPWPHETERRFWSLTLLPSTNRSGTQRRLATISVNNVEALVLAEVRDGNDWLPGGFLNVSPRLIGRSTKREWPVERSMYRTVGEVDRIDFDGVGGLVALLERPDVVIAARRFALGLMRKGRGMMAKYHDEGLADDVFTLYAELGRG